MKPKDEIEPVEVFAGNGWQAGMVKSILEDEEIEAFLKDEVIGALSPWYVASGGAGSVKVYVSSADYDRAMAVVKQYEKNIKEDRE